MPSRRILLARFPLIASHTQALFSLRNRCEARRSVRPQRPIWRTAYDSALSFPNSLCALIRFDFRVNGFASPPAKATRHLCILPHFAQKSMNFSVDARPRCTAGVRPSSPHRAPTEHLPCTEQKEMRDWCREACTIFNALAHMLLGPTFELRMLFENQDTSHR